MIDVTRLFWPAVVVVVLGTACVFDRQGFSGPHPDSLVGVDQALDAAGQADRALDVTVAPEAGVDAAADTAAPDTLAPDLLPPLEPLAHWRFDTGSGPTAYDSAAASHGKIVNASWTPGGHTGNALVFNGSSSLVEVPHSSKLDLTDAISIVAWVKADAVDVRQVIVSKTASGNNTWLFEINPIDFSVGIASLFLNTTASAGGGDYLGSKSAVAKGAWQHLACVYDGQHRRIYLNGSLDSSAPHTGKIHTNGLPIRIGTWSSNSRYFKGIIDEVAIFDSALSAAEVKRIYTNGL